MRFGALFVSAFVVLGLSGCSGGQIEPAAAVLEEPAVLVAEPCELFSASDLETIFGTEVRAGRNGISRIDDAAIEADSRHCRWSADVLDASLQIAYGSDFDSGEFACLAPEDPRAVEADVGTRAWWSELTMAGSTLGRLRVCTTSSLVDITIIGNVDADFSAGQVELGSKLRSQAELMGAVTLFRIDR